MAKIGVLEYSQSEAILASVYNDGVKEKEQKFKTEREAMLHLLSSGAEKVERVSDA